MTTLAAPESDLDLFTDAALADPYPLYDELRAAGAAVWMAGLGVYALARYAETREALRDSEALVSGRGVALNDTLNTAMAGSAQIASDPPRHDAMRKVTRVPLTAAALRELTPTLQAEAQALVENLVERGSFDAVTDLAHHLPLTIISRLVGIPESGRQKMLEWAACTFEAQGPDGPRTAAALPGAIEMFQYGKRAVPPHLTPGGWAQMVYDAAARGEIEPELCPATMSAYLAPSLDTTINGIGSAMLLFGRHPEAWAMLREDRALIPNAVNEVLRLESPIQRFTRYAARAVTVGETEVPAGSRIMMLFGAANRDERRWPAPTQFDVRRERAAEHLAFGFGRHACTGSGLARLEMRLLLEALVERVERFTVADPVRAINQTLRGLASLTVTIEGGSSR
jgi:cytochrome P450